MGHHSKHLPQQNVNFNNLPRVPLTLDVIKTLSGDNNAFTKTRLRMKVNIKRYSIQNMGRLLPFLGELDISNSNIDTLRDLGTSMQHLRVLRVSNCKLSDLDGVSCLANLTHLEAPNNYITDVFPCALLQALESLDLEKNHIREFQNLGYLTVCSNLRHLILRNNPIDGMNYRKKVWTQIPQITFLDGVELINENEGEVDGDNMESHSQKLVGDNMAKKNWHQINDPPLRRRSNLTDLMNASKRFSYSWLLPREPTPMPSSNSMDDELFLPDEEKKVKKTDKPTGKNPPNLVSASVDRRLSLPRTPPFIQQKYNTQVSTKNKFSQRKFKTSIPDSFAFTNSAPVVIELSGDENSDSE